MDNQKSLTEISSEFICNLNYSICPKEVIEKVKICLIDCIGCIIAGSNTEEGKLIIEFAGEMTSNKRASIIGTGIKTSPLFAALANGYLGHIYEMDDVHKTTMLHPGVPVISAALAVAESEGKSGRELLEAIIAGYEITVRVGQTVSPSHYYFWHSTSTCGTFGAAAAAGKLLGLTEKEITWSLGNAGSQAAGLWEFLEDNAMTKYLHCGKAALNGLLSSLLAVRGLTGATKILEGKRGFIKATSQESKPELKFISIGDEYKIMETVFKPYPCCRHTHSPIDAAINVRTKHNIKSEDIIRVSLYVYKTATIIAGCTEWGLDVRAAKFSLAYCTAAALYYDTVGFEAFNKESLQKRDILDIVSKLTIHVDEEYTKLYPEKYISRIVVETTDGVYEEKVEYPKGDVENPLTDDELYKKFIDMTTMSITEKEAKKLLDKCRNIEQIENIATLFNEVSQ